MSKQIQRMPKYLTVEEIECLDLQPYQEGKFYKEQLKHKKGTKDKWLKRTRNKLFSAKRDYAIINLFYSSGIRLNELVKLNLSDLDFKRGIIRVLGKGNKERESSLTNEAIRILQGYLKARRFWRGNSNEALFLSRTGKRITKMNVQRNIEYYGIKAGITKKVTPHMLRYSIATHYLDEGMDIRKIQHFLGHSSLASTQIYTHILTDDQREERNRLHPQNRIKRKLI